MRVSEQAEKVIRTKRRGDCDLNCSQSCGNQSKNPAESLVGLVIP